MIHHFADRIRADLAGGEVRASSPQGRFDADALDGRRLLDVRAAGKHLFYDVENAPTVHVHLGMRGLFLHYPDPATPPRSGVRLRLASSRAAWDLIAPSACDLLDPAEVARILAKLGPDPLGPDDPAAAVTALRSFRGPVGAALLDQTVWAGVGNAWRAELLHLAHLHPRTPCADLSADQTTALWDLSRRLMALGRDAGQLVSDPTAPDQRWVYKRATCRSCGADVATAQLAGRTAHWCPVEQSEHVHALGAPRSG